MRTRITAYAPGKIILSGEHAVVHGGAALATVIDRGVTVELIPRCDQFFQLTFSDLSTTYAWTQQDFAPRAAAIEARYQQFLAGEIAIREVLENSFLLLPYAVDFFLKRYVGMVTCGFTLNLTSDLMIGAGMGSSAALIIAIFYALSAYYKLPLPADLLTSARLVENLQHGYSSGLDLVTVAKGGGCYGTAGNWEPLLFSAQPLTLIYTGKPQSSTGECVQHVAAQFTASLKSEFRRVTQNFKEALITQNRSLLYSSVQHNQELLMKLGVVSPRVSRFIAELAQLGNVAKISGAGSICGEACGMLIMWGTAPIGDLLARYGYVDMRVIGGGKGACLLSS